MFILEEILMSKKTENIGFICENCKETVDMLTNGSYRNHCPFCLCSKHVDNSPGDRGSSCGGLMKPVEVLYKPGKGYQLVHRCTKCGKHSKNIIAEHSVQPDDMDVVFKLMNGGIL